MKQKLKNNFNIDLIKVLNILIFIAIIINPILDIYWFNNDYALRIFNVTIPTIIRFALLFAIAIIFIIKYRKLKFFICYGALLIIYLIFQYMNCNFGNYSFFMEIRYVFVLAYPIFLLYIISHTEIDKRLIKKALIILACLVSFLIIIPTIFGFAICSYSEKVISGTFFDWFKHDMDYLELASRGVFYTSITGCISLILIPVIYYLYYKENKLLYLILTFLLAVSCLMIGTRACSYGAILAFSISIFLGFLFELLNTNKITLKKVIWSLILLAIFIFVFINAPIISRAQDDIRKKDEVIDDLEYKLVIDNKIINCIDYPNDVLIKKIKELKHIYVNDQFIYEFYPYQNDPQFWCDIINNYDSTQQSNNRLIEQKMLQRAIYLNNNKNDKFFGYGFSKTTSIFNLEKDFLYQYYSLGIMGSVITVGIYILFFVLISFNIILKKKYNYYNFCLMLSLGMFMFYAYYSGNTFNNLSVTITIAILMSLLTHNVFKKKEIKKQKVTIMALHLGVGGVEKYISSLCKMLENDYEIEIISSYKVSENPGFYFSKKIKIKYLINDRPYKNEFKNAIQHLNIIDIIKYGYKNFKILILKHYREAKAIYNIDSKYVITTIFHNKIVNDLLDNSYIKIATEHNYHNNNKKYIKKLIQSCTNFQYLICVSEELQCFYQNKFSKCQVIYIPNVIDDMPKIISNKQNKSLIVVGRLVKEKGLFDLIDIINLVKKEISDVQLNIVGDGPILNEIISKINNLSLNDNIHCLGALNHDKMNLEMQKAMMYVMTSYTESFGLVLIEAMSNKTACIAFDSASGARYLLNNDNGILIPERNKEIMAQKIIYYLKNPLKLDNYINKSYDYCQQFLLISVKKQWLNLLKSDASKENNNMNEYFKRLYKDSAESFYKILNKNLKNGKKQFIVTANPETFMYGIQDRTINDILLDDSTTIVPDGISIVKAAKRLNYNIKERIAGIDIAVKLLEYGNNLHKSIYLFGAKQEIIDAMKEIIKEKYPNLKIAGLKNGYVKDKNSVFDEIVCKKPDIVLVALGIPEQEKSIYNNIEKFDKGIFVGVGGSFDVISGKKKRAPKIFIKMNLEWLYRIITEPKRIKRFYNNNIKFLLNIKKYK